VAMAAVLPSAVGAEIENEGPDDGSPNGTCVPAEDAAPNEKEKAPPELAPGWAADGCGGCPPDPNEKPDDGDDVVNAVLAVEPKKNAISAPSSATFLSRFTSGPQ